MTEQEHDDQGPKPFDPDSASDREQLARDAYTRQIEIVAARAAEQSGSYEERYFIPWDQLDEPERERFRSCVDALCSILRID